MQHHSGRERDAFGKVPEMVSQLLPGGDQTKHRSTRLQGTMRIPKVVSTYTQMQWILCGKAGEKITGRIARFSRSTCLEYWAKRHFFLVFGGLNMGR